MTSHVRIGDNRIFTLKTAVLLYQEGSTTFATLHEVESQQGVRRIWVPASRSPPVSGEAGKRLEQAWHRRCCRQHTVKTPELIVWWSPEKRRLMFFARATKNNGIERPNVSHLGWCSCLTPELLVRALGENRRPTSDTRLKNAPTGTPTRMDAFVSEACAFQKR